MLRRDRLAGAPRFLWTAADVAVLTGLLFLAELPYGPLVVGSPLLIAASGLFFQERLVWFTTLISLVAYAGLNLLQHDPLLMPHDPIIFAAVLAVLGFIVAYQVHRMRVLSRYYETRKLP